MNPNDHWMAGNPHITGTGANFTALRSGREIGVLNIGVPGTHMVLIALAAAAVCTHLEVPFKDISRATARFKGAKRRFEMLGEVRGVLVMDDYAHHPSEVRATLAAARARFGGRRLIAIFQPHTYSRTRYL
ncbi:MAG: cyanophycin synthetase, partial [Dehalococcoidia bacterium]